MKFKILLIILVLAMILMSAPAMAQPLDRTELFGPPVPREFPSLEHFEKWRDAKLIMYIKGEPYRLPTKTYSPVKDCDDVAEAWQRRALDDGFLVSAQVIEYGRLLGVRVSRSRGAHDGIRANIKNNVYYLDTFAPYEITLVCRRD